MSDQSTFADSAGLLQVLLDLMPENIYFKDADGRFTHVSRSLAAFYGVAGPRQVIGKTDFDFYPAEDAARYRLDEQEIMGRGAPLILKEEKCINESGETTFHRTSKVPIRNHAGTVVGVAGISHDVTAVKRTEAALRESEGLFRRVFDSDMMGIVFWNYAGGISNANNAYLRMVGYTRDDLDQGRVNWRGMTPPDLVPRDEYAVNEIKEHGACTPFEKDYIHRDGHRVPVLVGGSLLPDSQTHGVAFALDLTDRKRAEQELHKQRREQEIILDSVPAMIWYKDRENRIIRANKAAAESGGMTKAQMEGKSTYDLYPEFAAAYHKADLEVINSGTPKMGIIEGLELAGGVKRWVRTDKIPYRDEKGEIIGVVVFSTDITDLKRAEAALRESEELFRTLAENSDVGFWRITPEGQTIYTNPAMRRMIQIESPDELRGRTFHEYFTPESVAAMQREHSKRLAGVASTYEAEVIASNGTRRNVLISGSSLMNPDGSLNSMIGTFTDITERKQAEDALRREQHLMQILMDNMPDAIYFKDRESRIMSTNRAHARFMGLASPQEAIGHTDIEFFKPEDARAFRADELEVITSGRTLENRIECHSGTKESPRWWSTTKVPIRDANGGITGIAGITREITPLKLAEDEIRKLNAELEQRVADRTAKLEATNKQLEAEVTERRLAEQTIRTYQEQLRSLASELSLAEERERRRIAVDLHDQIGQTLASIQMKLQAMRKVASDSSIAAGLDECVKLIRQPIHDTRSLVFNLSPPVLYDLGLESAVAWAVDQHQGRDGLRITFEDDERPKPLSEAGSVILFRAVRELLTNVVKHSKARTVRVWLRTGEDSLRVGVEDDGKGFVVSSLGAYSENTGGFGLFSIREQLNRLGGTMQIDSAPGRGSVIMLTVPLDSTATLPTKGVGDGNPNSAR